MMNTKKKSPPKSKLALRFDGKLPRRQKALEGARKFLFDEEDDGHNNTFEQALQFEDDADTSRFIPRSRLQWQSERFSFSARPFELEQEIEAETGYRGNAWTRRLLLAFVPTILAFVVVCATIVIRKDTKHGGGETPINYSNVNDTLRFDIMFQKLVGYSDHNILNTRGSPQNKALRWLTDYDNSNVDPNSDNLAQRYALATLFFATNEDLQPHDTSVMTKSDEGWHNHSDWLSGKGICVWYGIECPHRHIGGIKTARYDKDADVVKLLLDNNNIHGTLPKELAALGSLKVFDFRMNNIDVSSLLLATKFDALEYLDLKGNQFAPSTIPNEVSRLSRLRGFDISSNQFQGSVPEGIETLRKLEIFDVADNMLSGSLPGFSGLNELSSIDLSENNFEGTVPAQYGSLGGLVTLHLQSNNLEGKVPDSICSLADSGLLKTLTADCSPDGNSASGRIECSCCSECSR